ncbi:hypothetical protein JP0246_15080 [Helicobacter pylori]
MALNLYNDNLKPLNNDTALLEQYKIAINSAEKISDRRTTANNFFIALNSVLFSLNNIDKLKSFDDFFSTIIIIFFYSNLLGLDTNIKTLQGNEWH